MMNSAYILKVQLLLYITPESYISKHTYYVIKFKIIEKIQNS